MLVKLISRGTEKIFMEVVKIFSWGSEEIFTHNNTSNIKVEYYK